MGEFVTQGIGQSPLGWSGEISARCYEFCDFRGIEPDSDDAGHLVPSNFGIIMGYVGVIPVSTRSLLILASTDQSNGLKATDTDRR